MFKRIIIISVGATFAIFCVINAFITLFERNPATLHLTKILQIGYAAINVALTPFGIAGIIGGYARKKSLIRAFITYQWWLATFIVIGINVFNIALARNKGDFIRRCQNDLAKVQPNSDFSARCSAIADGAESAAFIDACLQGGIMLFLGILLLIVGLRECNSISSQEDHKNLLEKAYFDKNVDKMDETENLGDRLSPKTRNVNINGGGNIDTFVYDSGRYPPTNVTNIKRQPSSPIQAATAGVNLARRPTNENTINSVQYSGLRRNPTDPRNQTFIPQSYKGLNRNPTIPGNVPQKTLARYPINESVTNVTRKPTIGNVYTSRNYVGPLQPTPTQPTYPTMSLQRSPTTVNIPPPSYVTQVMIPPPQPTLMNVQNFAPITEVNDYSNYNDSDYSNYGGDYVRKPYNSPTKTTAPYLTRVAMIQ